MIIDKERTLVLSETVLQGNLIVPFDKADRTVIEFLRHYNVSKNNSITRETSGVETVVTVALCYLNEKESWSTVSSELKKEGWAGASLILWSKYIEDNKEVTSETITIPGTRYRDDEYVEWVPLVRYKRHFLFKKATEIVSMKLALSLRSEKARVLLVSKIMEKKL